MQPSQLRPLIVPELGLRDILVRASLWLVPAGSFVHEGERVVELLAGEVTFDVVSPASGILWSQQAEEDEVLTTGQVLGQIKIASC